MEESYTRRALKSVAMGQEAGRKLDILTRSLLGESDGAVRYPRGRATISISVSLEQGKQVFDLDFLYDDVMCSCRLFRYIPSELPPDASGLWFVISCEDSRQPDSKVVCGRLNGGKFQAMLTPGPVAAIEGWLKWMRLTSVEPGLVPEQSGQA